MIIGNPYTFSIIIDIVDEWNIDKSFNNGLLFIGVNGVLIPDKILNATLNVEIPVFQIVLMKQIVVMIYHHGNF